MLRRREPQLREVHSSSPHFGKFEMKVFLVLFLAGVCSAQLSTCSYCPPGRTVERSAFFFLFRSTGPPGLEGY